ncbi:YbgC/FadM family acyl-CoA thioesterase [Nitratifractor sp.]
MQIRVYYEDTDTGGIVYHSHYLNFCERARSELFFSRGMLPGDAHSGFVVRKVAADFLGMARLGDLLMVHTQTLERGRSRLRLRQWIEHDGETIFTMEVELAYLRMGRPAQIPAEILALLETVGTGGEG